MWWSFESGSQSAIDKSSTIDEWKSEIGQD